MGPPVHFRHRGVVTGPPREITRAQCKALQAPELMTLPAGTVLEAAERIDLAACARGRAARRMRGLRSAARDITRGDTEAGASSDQPPSR